MRQYIMTFCAILLTSASPLYASLPCGQYEYVMKVQVPVACAIEGPWIGYYRGTCIPFKGNLARLCSSKMRFTFSLIITPTLRHAPSPATRNMPILMRSESAPVAWFDLSLVLKNGKWMWDIISLKQEEMPLRLPDHALILLFDPQLISLQSPIHTKYAKDATYEGGCAIIEFPTIVIKASEATLRETLQAAYCASLDVRTFHELVTCEERVVEGCCCSHIVS